MKLKKRCNAATHSLPKEAEAVVANHKSAAAVARLWPKTSAKKSVMARRNLPTFPKEQTWDWAAVNAVISIKVSAFK